MSNIEKLLGEIISEISQQSESDLISSLNFIREKLHDISPFKNEPVDFVKWVPSDMIHANDYNPNSVAPPEMQLLEVSIVNDGYTQPIVTWPHGDKVEVIDGFHRNRVGKESSEVAKRIKGYLPTVIIKKDRENKGDRMASTIRHNRARGKHTVSAMSDIVLELKKRNWSEARIGKELGMDEDEILRLCQISGLAEAFENDDFSKAWESAIHAHEPIDIEFENTDGQDISHLDKWECYRAGFFEVNPPNGADDDDCTTIYTEFLRDIEAFRETANKVIREWKYSCEHNLTNERMNRIAWMGQAALAYRYGIPSRYRGGYHQLTTKEKELADNVALEAVNEWLLMNNYSERYTLKSIESKTEVDLY